MKVSTQTSSKLCIVSFAAKHSHELVTPKKVHILRSQRKLAVAQAIKIDMDDSSGIAPKAGIDLLARHVRGRENLGFIPIDYKNCLRPKKTKQMNKGDTGGVLEYLEYMKFEDPKFLYAIQVDEEDLIINIFWADSRMTVDYDCFRDVVCFDTTYSKNNEGCPLRLFVGLNHHKQILYGAALLYDEIAATFMWLFDLSVKAMSGKKPKTILIDQDAAMAKALASQWPKTHHRLCLKHIYQNPTKNLSTVFERNLGFDIDFIRCIYDYEDEDEFLNLWNLLLNKYDLQSNNWLA